jgi:hypothetical protein
MMTTAGKFKTDQATEEKRMSLVDEQKRELNNYVLKVDNLMNQIRIIQLYSVGLCGSNYTT